MKIVKINTSICATCKYFEHDCDRYGDFDCGEDCSHLDKEVQERFYEEDEIRECTGYTKE